MSKEKDRRFLRNFSVLITLLAVFATAMIYLSRHVGPLDEAPGGTEEVARRIAPVGQVNTKAVVEPEAPAAPVADAGASGDRGQQVYDNACFVCHATPAVGAPVMGDAADWAPRLEKGIDVLYGSALNGFQGEKGVMLPKGGRPDLSDEDVKAAVRYMVRTSGGADLVGPEDGVDAAAPAPTDPLALGKEVYDSACLICHTTGAAGAPRIGDGEAWSPRLARGVDTLRDHAIKGYMGEFGLMPPKGGRADLSDEQVIAALTYMLESID
jgi:cytochrome c5